MIQGDIKVTSSWTNNLGEIHNRWYRASTNLEKNMPKDILELAAKFIEERAKMYAPGNRNGLLKSTLKAEVVGDHAIKVSSQASYLIPQEKGYEAHWIPIDYFYQDSPGTEVRPVTGWREVGQGSSGWGKYFIRKAVEDLKNEIGYKLPAVIRKHIEGALK